MQVVNSEFTRQSVFLLESDQLSLSSSFDIAKAGAELHDRDLGAVHALHHPGSMLIQALAEGMRADELQALAAIHKIHPTQLHELWGFLNSVGALRIQRRGLGAALRAGSRQLQHALHGIRYSALVWRRPATAQGLIGAVLRVCGPVNLAALVVTVLLAGSGLMAPTTAAIMVLFGVSLFTSSIYLHELGHLLVLWRSEIVAVLLQHDLRLGIVHRELDPRREIVSALAGPIVGVTWCGLVGATLAMAGQAELALLGSIIALFHVSSFLPSYGDGRSIVRAVQELSNVSKRNLYES